jgi:hypothetical protein
MCFFRFIRIREKPGATKRRMKKILKTTIFKAGIDSKRLSFIVIAFKLIALKLKRIKSV